MSLYHLARSVLFRLEPEKAHRLIMSSLAPAEALLERLPRRVGRHDALLSQTLLGVVFPNPVGLAAGFDKDGDLPRLWAALGFGFVEVGTVTRNPQPGNPQPRLFRLPEDEALINRLGFNSRGCRAVAGNLQRRLRSAPREVPIGVNIGKSAATPVEDAAEDYAESFRQLAPLADYVVVNVSSPNTAGLRDMQAAKSLQALLRRLGVESDRLAATGGLSPRPVLVKLAPDLADGELGEIVPAALEAGAGGFVATNTTVQRSGLRAEEALQAQRGGLSGPPLRQRSTEMVRQLYRLTEGRVPIIGVGGVASAPAAYEKIRAGASLVQVYTGIVYEGPALARIITWGLARLLERDGIPNIAEAVGRDA